ncbi:hypothetical protein B0H13DRAFT_1913605 [Mycena leptocephala]|nr:hypothetical protein B0H13DRAFT_1913605 [Mycena leptocephala]
MCPLLGDATLNAISEGFMTRLCGNQQQENIVREKLDTAFVAFALVDFTSVNLDSSDQTRVKFSGEDVVAQTAVILIAGQETTGRHSFPSEHARVCVARTRQGSGMNAFIEPEHTITQRGIHSLLAKEALRVYPAGPLLERIAVQDTVIPVINPIATSTGEYSAQIPVQKGQLVTLDVGCYQRLESRWGADAHEFRPSRWTDGTTSNGEAIGPYANLSVYFAHNAGDASNHLRAC